MQTMLGIKLINLDTVGKFPSNELAHKIRKLINQSCTIIPKKYLKVEYQLFFRFINKVFLPKSKKDLLPLLRSSTLLRP